MAAALSSVLTPDELPLAELHAARLDGELMPLGFGFCPIDLPEAPALRALSLRSAVPERVIAEQHTAAWIWGALAAPPARHTLCVAAEARVSRAPIAWAHLREVSIEVHELAVLAGLRLTTPLRTAFDLARWQHPFTEQDAEALRGLAAVGGFGLRELIGRARQGRNLPHRLRTLDRIEAVLGHSDVP